MQSICRDVFQSGSSVPSLDPVAVVLATISGLFCSVLVYVAIRGGLRNMARSRNEAVEFTVVDSDASMHID